MPHDFTTLLADIEDAITQRLSAGIVGIRQFDVNDSPGAVKCPALSVALFRANLKQLGRRTYRMDPYVYVTLLTANPRSEKLRRRSVYPLLTATMTLLAHWRPVLVEGERTVDLGASELRLSEFRKTLEADTRLAFTLEVRTDVGFEIPAEAGLIDVEKIALQYVLKPGDDSAETEDIVEVNQ